MNQLSFHRSVLGALAGLALLALAPAASAFQLVPISMQFAPTGNDATQTFGILNDGQDPIAVQVSIVTRQVAADGAETQLPADNDFTVYPSQAVVAPGKVQFVQVRWIGDAHPAKELSYRILAEQLKVELAPRDALGGRISILMRYEGALYVTPPGTAPSVAVESVKAVETASGRQLAVTVRNQGTSHGALDAPVLTVQAPAAAGRPAAKVELRDEALGDLGGANVLAGSVRQYLLPWPDALPVGATDLSASLKTGYVR